MGVYFADTGIITSILPARGKGFDLIRCALPLGPAGELAPGPPESTREAADHLEDEELELRTRGVPRAPGRVI